MDDSLDDLLSESSAASEDSSSESEEDSSSEDSSSEDCSSEDSSSSFEEEEEGPSLILVPKAVVEQWAKALLSGGEPALKAQQQEALDFVDNKSALVAAGLGVGKTEIGRRWLLDKEKEKKVQVMKSRNQLSKLMVWTKGEWQLREKKGVVLMTHSLYSSLVTGKRAESFWNNNKEQIQVKQLEKAAKQEGNRQRGRLAGFLLASWRAVVMDEAHVARNSKTALWRALEWLRRQVSRMLLLTGTPVVNRVQDLAALSALVNPKYDEAWWGKHGSSQDKVAKWRSENMYYCEADVPAVAVETVGFELSSKETATYLESYNILKREVSDMESSMVHILAALQRVRQAMNCESKFAQVLSRLSQLPGKSLVFSQWTRSIRQLAEKLPAGSWLEYSGRLTGKQREAVLREFAEKAEIKYLLITYGAGGVGLNLQHSAQNVILLEPWYPDYQLTLRWNEAVEAQAWGRVNRFGQKSPVRVMRLLGSLAGGVPSIEEWLQQIKSSKAAVAEAYVRVGDVAIAKSGDAGAGPKLVELQEFIAWVSEREGKPEKRSSLASGPSAKRQRVEDEKCSDYFAQFFT